MKFNDIDIQDAVICEGDGIKIVADTESKRVILSAPNTNKTTLKVGPFTLTGDAVEVAAGDNVRISSVHPNKLTISADIAKETARIVELEKQVKEMSERCQVIEKAFSQIIKAVKKG